jgi:hypothetical protein
MAKRPSFYNALWTWRHLTGNQLASLNGEQSFKPLIIGMEMCWWMVAPLHLNNNAKEYRNRWHRVYAP